MSQDTAVKLERLLMEEVSGVDRPANMLDGFAVMKAAGPSYPIGPDQTWDVGAAEKRIRAATGAEKAPNAKYASCFLSKSGDGTKFGDYKFLVCDVVDGDIKVMPAAIRAAASRLPGSKIDDKDAVQAKIDALEAKAGIGDKATKSTEEDGEATSILRKIKELVFPGSNDRGEEIEMTSEELTKALDERLGPIVEAVEALKSASEAATEAEVVDKSKDAGEETEASVTAESVSKALEDGVTAALEPYNEILEKVLDRIEGVEKALGYAARKSLDGQESNSATDEGNVEKASPVSEAIAKAFRTPAVASASGAAA